MTPERLWAICLIFPLCWHYAVDFVVSLGTLLRGDDE
jgi:hypothetical protein